MGLLAEATVDAADDPVAVRRFAGKLQAEAVRLGALVNELIALSRLQGAEPLPDLAVVEVDAVIDETVSRVATTADNAGITVTTDEPSGCWSAAIGSLLITALTNLVDNAINYSPAGTRCRSAGRCGTVRCRSPSPTAVSGSPQRTPERVFERFFRVDQARSRATGGTGLGLAIVKHVAANHGGTATVWSRPGTGSTFTMRAAGPGGRTAPESTSDAGEPHRHPNQNPSPPRSTVTKVLIVEDEESMADPLAFLLRREGFSTEIAATAPTRWWPTTATARTSCCSM